MVCSLANSIRGGKYRDVIIHKLLLPDLDTNVRVLGDDPEAADRILALTSAAFELPSSFLLGASYDLEMGENGLLRLAATYQSNHFSEDEYRFGAEYNLANKLYVRGGYVYCDQDEYLYGPTLGVGARFNLGRAKACFDYSHTFVNNYFDDIPEISLRFGI